MDEANTKGRAWRAIMGLLVVTLIAVAVWRLWPRERLLLEHAVKVTDWKGSDRTFTDYAWASENEAVLYSDPTALSDSDGQFHVFSHDTSTGIEKTLTGLASHLNERDSHANTHWLSPDGKWMLYSDCLKGMVKATPRDGSRRITWYSELWNPESVPASDFVGFGQIYWLPDSHHWVQPLFARYGLATRLVVRCIDKPHSARSIVIPPVCRSLFAEQSTTYLNEPVVWLSETHLFMQTASTVPWADSKKHSVDFFELNLASEAAPRKWTVHLPKEWIIKQVVWSPYADRVAWVFHQRYVSPLLTMGKRLGLPIQAKPLEETMVYVSRNDGTEMREIGVAPTPEEAIMDVQIAWVPGDKRLSFAFKNVLYTVPVL